MESLVNVRQIMNSTRLTQRAIQKRLKNIAPAKLEPHPGHPIRWYRKSDLPDGFQIALLNAEHETPPALPVVVEPAMPVVYETKRRKQNLADLPEKDRECNEARARIHRYVKEHPGSAEAAIASLNDHRAAGTLPKGMGWAFGHAWNKPRGCVLTLDTLNKWIGIKKVSGSYAPLKVQKDNRIQPWHPLAVELRRRPQGSTLTWLHEQLAANWNNGGKSGLEKLH
ncbi:MAG: hypothetical protein ABL860_08040 [Candidatus Nitrotoga sp.]